MKMIKRSVLKVLLVLFCSYAATVAQAMWSMYDLRNRISSDMDGLPLLTELLVFSWIIPAVFLIPVMRFSFKFKWNIIPSSVVIVAFLSAYWIYLDYAIFDSRAASWSTYSRSEIIFHITGKSIIPVTVSGFFMLAAAAFILDYKNKKDLL
ncbi:MAG: hypothetical protein JW982_15840 [Spirochaetes bacterium]|nr:hypothetical protein [Spirochaetota bacterium]